MLNDPGATWAQVARAITKQLKEIKEQVAVLNASLAKLNKNKAEKVAILTNLEETAEKMAKRLNAASKLIKGLGGEQVRW